MRNDVQKAIEKVSTYVDKNFFTINHGNALKLIDEIESLSEANAINFCRYAVIYISQNKGESIKDIYDKYKK